MTSGPTGSVTGRTGSVTGFADRGDLAGLVSAFMHGGPAEARPVVVIALELTLPVTPGPAGSRR
jgi:hypothetical protein